jgi:hypothetical protein
MRYIMFGALVLGLAACGQAGQEPTGQDMMAMDAAAPAVASVPNVVAESSREVAPPPSPSEPGAPQVPGTPPGPVMLAYSYAVSLQLPAKAVEPVLKKHQQTCEAAGPQLCQVLGANVGRQGDDIFTGQLNLRAEPKWLARFRGQLQSDAEAADGELVSSQTSTEDLTRSIIDTDARLKSQKTLRERLQKILAERPGKLSDLLEVERELARVQAEIDSAESALAVMRQRVAMSELALSYQSAVKPLTDTTLNPLGEAFAGFLGVLAGSLAAIITLTAGVLPWALVLGGIGWAIFRLVLRRRRLAALNPEPPASS